MNKRIKELYSQAGLTMNNPLAYEQWYLDSLEKFAELLVRECIELNRQELAFNAFERMLNRYKEHFGVK